ncbi:MAG TPA: sigma-70 family RNA polymerase sigma factor [Phycisphaerales bacterium]|nr:sigma-70 family RNA polymerase sigma factor [Phycisphaerales bacterium]
MHDEQQIPRAHAGDTEDVRRLCLGIRRGDEASLTAMYRAWHTRAIYLTRSWSGLDEMACEDAAHELFLRVIRALPELDSHAAVDAWMTTTLRRIVLDLLRAKKRAVAREERASHSSESIRPLSSLENVGSLENDLMIRIAQLEEHEREALRLRVTSPGTLAQLALSLQLSPDQFYGRVKRAIAKLKALAEDGHD